MKQCDHGSYSHGVGPRDLPCRRRPHPDLEGIVPHGSPELGRILTQMNARYGDHHTRVTNGTDHASSWDLYRSWQRLLLKEAGLTPRFFNEVLATRAPKWWFANLYWVRVAEGER